MFSPGCEKVPRAGIRIAVLGLLPHETDQANRKQKQEPGGKNGKQKQIQAGKQPQQNTR